MIPKTIKKEPDDKITLPDQLSKLFPQVNDEGKISEQKVKILPVYQ